MMLKLPCHSALILFTGFLALLLSSCAQIDMGNKVLVSVRDQKMMILKEGLPVKSYPVSEQVTFCENHAISKIPFNVAPDLVAPSPNFAIKDFSSSI